MAQKTVWYCVRDNTKFQRTKSWLMANEIKKDAPEKK